MGTSGRDLYEAETRTTLKTKVPNADNMIICVTRLAFWKRYKKTKKYYASNEIQYERRYTNQWNEG